MQGRGTWRQWLATGVLAAWTINCAVAASLTVDFKDQGGKPVADAVAWLTPVDGKVPPARSAKAIMDQVDKEFVPHVLVIRPGTEVSFPNHDNIRHNVYSFSAPKKFKLPLYKGQAAKPVLFDKPGIDVLGCEIHDWMVGYIVAVDTPWYGKSAASGQLTINDVPNGDYTLHLWHGRLKGPIITQKVTLNAAKTEAVTLNLKPPVED